jgi:hypothetical protein
MTLGRDDKYWHALRCMASGECEKRTSEAGRQRWRPESGVKGTGAVPVMVMLSGSGDILGAVVVPGPDL